MTELQAPAAEVPFWYAAQVAEILGMSEKTVRIKAATGKFPGAYKAGGGAWRFPRSEIAAMQQSVRARAASR